MKQLQLVEVGLRDGLQNEKSMIGVPERVQSVLELLAAGLNRIELGAYVHPQRVPQMAGTLEVVKEVLAKTSHRKGFSVLIPNDRGYDDFLRAPVPEIAIFASATEKFSQKNINCSIEESFERFEKVVRRAKKDKIKVRGYLSMCFGCPYEGEVDPKKVVELVKRLLKLGCYEVSIGDTIGVASPDGVIQLIKLLKKAKVPMNRIAGHFHDTRGTALANIYAAYREGVYIFDTSLGGLGGCPYAPGASGNVSTEDVVYMFQRSGLMKKIDLQKLIDLNKKMSAWLGKELPSKVGKAGRWPSHKHLDPSSSP